MDTNDLTKEYTNDEVTIVWKNSLCKHAAECVKTIQRFLNQRKNLGYIQKILQPKKLSKQLRNVHRAH